MYQDVLTQERDVWEHMEKISTEKQRCNLCLERLWCLSHTDLRINLLTKENGNQENKTSKRDNGGMDDVPM